MQKVKSRKKYEAPRATFVQLKPEERLLQCAKLPDEAACQVMVMHT